METFTLHHIKMGCVDDDEWKDINEHGCDFWVDDSFVDNTSKYPCALAEAMQNDGDKRTAVDACCACKFHSPSGEPDYSASSPVCQDIVQKFTDSTDNPTDTSCGNKSSDEHKEAWDYCDVCAGVYPNDVSPWAGAPSDCQDKRTVADACDVTYTNNRGDLALWNQLRESFPECEERFASCIMSDKFEDNAFDAHGKRTFAYNKVEGCRGKSLFHLRTLMAQHAATRKRHPVWEPPPAVGQKVWYRETSDSGWEAATVHNVKLTSGDPEDPTACPAPYSLSSAACQSLELEPEAGTLPTAPPYDIRNREWAAGVWSAPFGPARGVVSCVIDQMRQDDHNRLAAEYTIVYQRDSCNTALDKAHGETTKAQTLVSSLQDELSKKQTDWCF